MILETCGLSLSRLKEEDIELVRRWRNSEKISRHMKYRDQITPGMQKKWFKSINNTSNYFFILRQGETKIGLVNLSAVDYDKQDAETGIFIWDDEFIGKGVPVKALLILMSFGYYCLELKLVYGIVLRDNMRAINCYKKVGAVITEEIDDQQVMMKATRGGFESKLNELENQGFSECLKKEKTRIIMAQQDYDDDLAEHFLESFEKLPTAFQNRYLIVKENASLLASRF